MLMEQERRQIVDYGNRLIADRLTSGTAGNLSMYDPETGYMAISPSGIPYADTKPEDVVIMDLDGNIIEGTCKPSSEHALHAVFYKIRPEVRAVCHAHSMYCTTLACMGEPLKSVHYALADAMVPELPLVPFHVYGTPELAKAVEENFGDKALGALLANHGMISCGASMKAAYGLAMTMEWCAEVQWRCMAAGKMNLVSDEAMAITMEKYKTYGQKSEDGQPHGYHG